MSNWLLLHYRLPSHPSARRVYVWRKLRRLGAVLLQDMIWVLPDTVRTAEQYQWLLSEIRELGGKAFFWRTEAGSQDQADSLIEQFNEHVDGEYGRLLDKLSRPRPDLAGLSRRYQQIVSKDYFHSRKGIQVREKLLALRGEQA